MAAKIPSNTFTGVESNPSVGVNGPTEIKTMLEIYDKMFDPAAVHDTGEAGGIQIGNLATNEATATPTANKLVLYDPAGNLPGSIASAVNVTTNINSHAITDIFEADGETVKEATHAISADSATNANTVDSKHAGVAADNVLLLDGSGLVPLANIPTTLTGKSVTGSSGSCTGNAATATTANGILETGTGALTIHKKVINIGNWNMDSVTAVDVTHGLTFSKIIGVSVFIVNDNGNYVYSAHVNVGLNFVYWSATSITISRLTGGFLDNASFSSTLINRGWVIVEYTD